MSSAAAVSTTPETGLPDPEFRDAAQADNKQQPLHRWVPWIAGFSSRFVADVFDHYLGDVDDALVLDPFAGVGTTLVEAQLRGWQAVGFEINAYAALACRTKLGASRIDADALAEAIAGYRETVGAIEELADSGRLNGRRPLAVPPTGFATRIPFYPEKVAPRCSSRSTTQRRCRPNSTSSSGSRSRR